MWFQYKDIDFDYNEKYMTEGKIIDFIKKAIEIAINQVSIYEINVEDEGDAYYIYIIKQGPKDAWDSETIAYVQLLQNDNYDVMYADEDYGDEFDVIIIYND